MKHFMLVAALCLGGSAAAFETASDAECQGTWAAFVDMTAIAFDESNSPDTISVAATDDGWCRMTGGTRGLEGATFATLDYRVDGINRMIVDGDPPTALAVRIADLMTEGDRPRLLTSVDIVLSHDQPSQTLLVENVEMIEENGGRLQLTALFSHLNLSNRGTMMMSIGGISLSQVIGVMDVVNGDDIFEARRNTPQDRQVIVESFAVLPDAIASDATKDALAAFLGDTSADGRLQFGLRSERGIGFIQAAMGTWVNDITSEDDFSDALALMLDGAVVTFDWEPALTIEQ